MVEQHVSRAFAGGYHGVHAAIVIDVPNREATAGPRLAEDFPGCRRNIHKALGGVPYKEDRLAIVEVVIDLLDGVHHVALRDEQVFAAVVVIIDKVQTHA